jgi:aminoglycoside phosphotransferase (APT) family kinase protein
MRDSIPEGLAAGVTDWLAGVAALSPPLSFWLLSGGKSNLTYVAGDREGRKVVLRRPPLGHLLESAHDVSREFRVLTSLAGSDVPAPAVFGLASDACIADAPVLAMEYVPGVLYDAAAADLLAPPKRHAAGLELVRALAKIHALDVDEVGLADFASRKPYARRQLKRWRMQWEASKGRELPAVTDVADRLERVMPAEGEVTLVHGDYHFLNALFDAETDRVQAILDWELSTLGDPLADLGGLLAYWPEPGEEIGSGALGITNRPGFPTRDEIARSYADASGRKIDDLSFWICLNCWKVAVIAEGILQRRGSADPAAGGVEPQVVERMLVRATTVADEAGF